MTTLLEQLRLSEVSGVDEPAHAAGSGWLMQKAKREPLDGLTVQAIGETGFIVAVNDAAERLGEDHFEELFGLFKNVTARKAKASGGSLPWRHGGASLLR
jgi:hypothetical protein